MKRRTNAGFLSDGEAERERLRLQQMVRGFAKANQSQTENKTEDILNKGIEKKQNSPIIIGPEFWKSDKGLIIKAIVINRAYNKDAILKVIKLTDEDYRKAATELFQAKLLKPYDKVSGNLTVTKELYYLCKRHFGF